jgi:hypothetical protein
VLKGRVFKQSENLKNFKDDSIKLKERIERQKENLLVFKKNIDQKEKFHNAKFLHEKLQSLIQNLNLFGENQIQTAETPKMKKKDWCWKPIQPCYFFRGTDNSDKSTHQKAMKIE